MAARSVRISPTCHGVLQKLARAERTSMQAILDQAVEDYRQKRILAANECRVSETRRRRALIVSVNPFNHGPADLVVALPITSKHKGIPLHVVLDPPEGGLKQQSFVKCEDVRSISKTRLIRRVGAIRVESLAQVGQNLRLLLGL